ncbi:hypothetical protein EF902_05445 [Streptomyces sp. WAC05858]|nr:hypothetical protein EF902_05445 [Streptomyces sp. WAC05858]
MPGVAGRPGSISRTGGGGSPARRASADQHCRIREALRAWGGLRIIGRLGGGNRDEVVEVIGDQGRRLVARLSRRTEAALDRELDLLERLGSLGFSVPAVVPTLDGCRRVAGVVVREWMDGDPPGAGDWAAVARELQLVGDREQQAAMGDERILGHAVDATSDDFAARGHDEHTADRHR